MQEHAVNIYTDSRNILNALNQQYKKQRNLNLLKILKKSSHFYVYSSISPQQSFLCLSLTTVLKSHNPRLFFLFGSHPQQPCRYHSQFSFIKKKKSIKPNQFPATKTVESFSETFFPLSLPFDCRDRSIFLMYMFFITVTDTMARRGLFAKGLCDVKVIDHCITQ